MCALASGKSEHVVFPLVCLVGRIGAVDAFTIHAYGAEVIFVRGTYPLVGASPAPPQAVRKTQIDRPEVVAVIWQLRHILVLDSLGFFPLLVSDRNGRIAAASVLLAEVICITEQCPLPLGQLNAGGADDRCGVTSHKRSFSRTPLRQSVIECLVEGLQLKESSCRSKVLFRHSQK